MKRLALLFLAALLLLSLCACAEEPAPTEPAPTESTAPACVHNWKAADCFYPKTCTLCGATEGVMADHSWDGNHCSVCGMVNAQNDPLLFDAWIHITKDKWDLFTFFPDGTCSVTKYYGKPVADYDMEQCARTAVASLQKQYGADWEARIAGKYHLVKIFDYYYVVQMETRSDTYVVEGNIITIGTIPPVKHLIIINDDVLENGEDDTRYIKLEITYISELLRMYNEIN